MDNKDFEEVEDIFGENIEENYDVPVYDVQSNNETNNSVSVQEVPSVDTVNEEIPVYENVQPVEEAAPIYEDVVMPETDLNVVTNSYDVQPEVTEEPRLVLEWRGKEIVNISRAFLDTNGAHQETAVAVDMPDEEKNFFAYTNCNFVRKYN